MATITPDQCSVFVQVWVDVNALQPNSTQGCYAVCNRSQQSTGEGTASLSTNVPTGSYVCWSVLPIDPQYNGQLSITSVGVQSGWSSPPAQYGKEVNVFTGQVNTAYVGGNIDSNIQFNYNGSAGPGQVTITLPVTMIPQKPSAVEADGTAEADATVEEYKPSAFAGQAPAPNFKDPNAVTMVKPTTVINAAIDTAYLYSQPPSSTPYNGIGVYMMDNQYSSQSNEGSLELNTQVNAGSFVGFNVFPINKESSNTAAVEIVAFEISSGKNIFGGPGWPQPQPSGDYQWIGNAMYQGNCTYQLKIKITPPVGPAQYYYWDPYMTCVS